MEEKSSKIGSICPEIWANLKKTTQNVGKTNGIQMGE